MTALAALTLAAAPLPCFAQAHGAEQDAKRALAEQITSEMESVSGKDYDPAIRSAVMEELASSPTERLEAFRIGDRKASSGWVPSALGSSTNDFVFTPVQPCRIFDTRPGSGVQGEGTGPLSPGVPISFDATFICNVPYPAAKAAVLNVVAVNASGPGNLRVWPWDNTNPPAPNASILNYSNQTPNLNIANALVVPLCNTTTATGGDCSDDVFLVAYVSSAHVVIDVLGYFAMPERSAVETMVVSQATTIGAGVSDGGNSPSCPVGYGMTGGGCHWNSFNTSLHISGDRPFGAVWRCDVVNGTGSSEPINVHAVCARTPGR